MRIQVSSGNPNGWHALMEHLQDIARRAGCESFILDSGTHRQQAHKFYFREGMAITSFNFKKSLK